jgi:hypothetical protein
LDGKTVAVTEASQPNFSYISQLWQHPQRLVLNVAIGGTMFNKLMPSKIKTSSMYIDWVKVFRAE